MLGKYDNFQKNSQSFKEYKKSFFLIFFFWKKAKKKEEQNLNIFGF